MKDFQYITSSHPQYIEQLYHDFVQDPASVDLEMKKFFEGFDFAVQSGYQPNGQSVSTQPAVSGTVDWKKEIGAYRLILGYRNRGHLLSTTNPIRKRKDRGARLDLENFGLADADLDHTVFAAELACRCGSGHGQLGHHHRPDPLHGVWRAATVQLVGCRQVRREHSRWKLRQR